LLRRGGDVSPNKGGKRRNARLLRIEEKERAEPLRKTTNGGGKGETRQGEVVQKSREGLHLRQMRKKGTHPRERPHRKKEKLGGGGGGDLRKRHILRRKVTLPASFRVLGEAGSDLFIEWLKDVIRGRGREKSSPKNFLLREKGIAPWEEEKHKGTKR